MYLQTGIAEHIRLILESQFFAQFCECLDTLLGHLRWFNIQHIQMVVVGCKRKRLYEQLILLLWFNLLTFHRNVDNAETIFAVDIILLRNQSDISWCDFATIGQRAQRIFSLLEALFPEGSEKFGRAFDQVIAGRQEDTAFDETTRRQCLDRLET